MRLRHWAYLGCTLGLACGDDVPAVPSGSSSTGAATSSSGGEVATGSTSTPADGTGTSSDGGSTAASSGTTVGSTDATSSTGSGSSSDGTSSDGGTSSGSSDGGSSGEESTGDTGGGDGCIPFPPDLDMLCGDGMLVGGELCYGGAPPLQSAGPSATRVWAGDLDDDGDPDAMVLVEFPAALTVLLNDGLGNLVYDDSYGLEPGVDVGGRDVAVADMDGDTWVDAVVVLDAPPSLRVMANDGGGAFTFPIVTPLPLPAYAVALADLDGDLNQDAIVSDAMGVTVYYGLGNGSFGMSVGHASPLLLEGRDLGVADFDGDGALDVAVAYSQTVAVYPGDGAGGLGVPWTVALAVSALGPQELAIGQLDSDANPDVIVADAVDGELWELSGVGDGTFVVQPVPRLGSLVAIGEGNADCDDDIYARTTAAMANELLVFPSNGAGGHLGAQPFGLYAGIVDLEPADFDGDGLDDVLFAIGPTGEIGVLMSDP